jgi:hypothetical protein
VVKGLGSRGKAPGRAFLGPKVYFIAVGYGF